MKVNEDILEDKFAKFVDFIKSESGEKFEAFASSKYLKKEENYKYIVYEEAKGNLANKLWKPEHIGTGKIKERVNSAIKASVNYNYERVANNLVDWRQKDNFTKKINSEKLESILFNFYKSKIKDSEAFEQLKSEGLTYQFIAYLFFIKNREIFLPISQERFDKIFKQIGLPEFKTSGNASWENYSEFCNIIKQVQKFLKTKDNNATLLDAHSFLWILGNQMQSAVKESTPTTAELVKPLQETGLPSSDESCTDELPSSPPPLTVEQLKQAFKSLENDQSKKVQNGFLMLKAHYRSPGRKISAEGLAKAAGYPSYSSGNEQYGSFAHQICDLFDYEPDMFSTIKGGWTNALCIESKEKDQLGHFQWILRAEVAEALEELGFVEKTNTVEEKPIFKAAIPSATELVEEADLLGGDEKYADELPLEASQGLFEGIKRTIIVNSYERNPKARQKCISKWKAICAVCGFDFEKIYGEIGKNFIHVHHKVKISDIGNTYEVDPINDLVPVCPNCHAMLHKKEPPIPIDELKSIMNEIRK